MSVGPSLPSPHAHRTSRSPLPIDFWSAITVAGGWLGGASVAAAGDPSTTVGDAAADGLSEAIATATLSGPILILSR
jgi:hypothetical protein